MLTAYQILHLEAMGDYIFWPPHAWGEFDSWRKKTDGDLSDSSSAVFFVYSGANFEKILLGKDLLF